MTIYDWWQDIQFETDNSATALRYETMLRVIAYDITDPKRLRRIARLCERFGARVQFSVFECWLDAERFDELLHLLKQEIRPADDHIVAYSLDQSAAKRRKSLGSSSCLTNRLDSCIVL